MYNGGLIGLPLLKIRIKQIKDIRMKKLIIALMLCPFLLAAQGIHFEKGSFGEALAKAKREKKLLFIDAYAVWCGPCKKMATTVFLEDKVGAYFNDNLIALQVDVEKGEGPMIKRKYDITGLPGYIFLDGDGIVVYRFSSAMPADAFLVQVNKAVEYSKEPNSIGRLAGKYEANKNDEVFVRTYLDKLKEGNSTNYIDVLENYLKIQKRIPESSEEMVVLLADHCGEIVFGGNADRIFAANYGSEAWKPFLKKDIREKFQKLGRSMVEKTTDYAIFKRDTTLLEMTMKRAALIGIKVDDAQRKRLYVFYYLQTGEGDKYKALVEADNDAYINSIKVDDLRTAYLGWQKSCAEGNERSLGTKPYAVVESEKIKYIVSSYAQFVNTQKEKDYVLRWAKAGYDILPGDAKMMSLYANVLYAFGPNKASALEIKEKSYDIFMKKGNEVKGFDAEKQEFEAMKAGKPVFVK